jgi:uncharacterized protein with HEPN domain
MSDDHVYLMHIQDSLREVQTFIQGESYESFLEKRMVQNAVMRSFEVVGEAARRISPELRKAHPEMPWRLMSDFRNKLIHDYFGLDLEVIWRSATEDTSLLLQQIEKLVEEA